MNFFGSLPWKKSVSFENVEHDEISAEDIISKSATYRITQGIFTSPISSDTEEEEEEEKKPMKKQMKKSKCKKRKKNEENDESEDEEIVFEDGAPYSTLTAKQHAVYVNFLLAIKKKATFQLPRGFVEMREAVEAEQNKFLEFIFAKWQAAFEKHHLLLDDVNKFMKDVWRIRLNCINSYPRFYKELKMIPLLTISENPKFEMTPLKVLLETGVVPKLHLPKEKATTKICTDYTKMSVIAASLKRQTGQQIPVSKDKNAEIFALKYKAHIVISSSALKSIASNVRPFDKEWQIPVVVKDYCIQDGDLYTFQKVVFIDKKFAPKTMTAAEKNAWYHKLAVKLSLSNAHDSEAFKYPEREVYENEWLPNTARFLCDNCKSFLNTEKQDKKNECYSGEESDMLIIDESCQSSFPEGNPDVRVSSEIPDACTCGKKLKIVYKDNKAFLSKIDKNVEYDVDISPKSKTNITYRLWKLYTEKKSREELNESFLKHQNPLRDITVLIRCKMDACEREGDKVMPVTLSSKMEYQAEYGAEKLNLHSLVREWTSLQIRPEAVLARVRINAVNEEVLMTEHAMHQDLSQYALGEYSYSMRSNVFSSLYSVFSNLISEKPGVYLLQHSERSGTFVRLFRLSSKNESTYDLHEDYSSVNPDVTVKYGTPPWTPIDSSILVPSFIDRKQIPATFKPRKLKGTGRKAIKNLR